MVKQQIQEEARKGKKFSANWKSENYLYFQFRDEFSSLSEAALSIEKGKLLPESEEFRNQSHTSHDKKEEEVGSAKIHEEDRSEDLTSG